MELETMTPSALHALVADCPEVVPHCLQCHAGKWYCLEGTPEDYQRTFIKIDPLHAADTYHCRAQGFWPEATSRNPILGIGGSSQTQAAPK